MKTLFFAQNYNKSTNKPVFRDLNYSKAFSLTKSSFEKSVKEISKDVKQFRMELYNPYSEDFCASTVTIDYRKPQIICLEHPDKNPKNAMMLKYDPKSTGFLKNRATGEPVETVILRAHDDEYDNEDTFVFMSKDLLQEYGYVSLSHHKNPDETVDGFLNPELKIDYPEVGLTGSRVIVDYLLNSNEKSLKGVGKLADKIEVEYSKENNVNPNIISYAGTKSHVAHFLRGKRFLPLEKNSSLYNFFLERYGCIDPNVVLENILKYSDSKHSSVECWKTMPMYMPKEMVEKIQKESEIKLPSFKGKLPIKTKDVKSVIKNIEMNIYNPYSQTHCYADVNIDLSKTQKIVLNNYRSKSLRDDALTLDYNPERFGFIKDKVNNKPLKTMILTSKDPYHSEEVGYHFLSEDLQKEYGYVHLSKVGKATYYDRILYGDIMRDYPELGIKGERIIVRYLRNWNDKIYGGIGKLADMMAVKFCEEIGIEPVIVSLADKGSHVAHYLRGKRFFPLEKDSYDYEKFVKKYKNPDPNKIMEELIANDATTPEQMRAWTLLGMYMPKEAVERYKQLVSEFVNVK